jgi:hypothetical protein
VIDQPSQYPHRAILDIKVWVLHAVEKHKEIFIAGDEWIKLRIQILKHGDSDSIVIVSGGSHEELVQEFVDNSYHDSPESLEGLPIVGLTETERAAGLHCIFSHSGVLVI